MSAPARVSEAIGWQGAVNPKKRALIERFAATGDALDLGSGRGWYAQMLAAAGNRVVAVDQQIRLDDPAIAVVEQSLEQPLPLDDASVDTVLAFDIIEHVAAEAQLLDEIARVLRPGGVAMVSVPHADDDRLATYYLTYAHFKDKTHHREYLPADLEQRFAARGFRTEALEAWGGAGYPNVILAFAGNAAVRLLLRVQLKVMRVLGLLDVGNCHGDVYGVFRKAG